MRGGVAMTSAQPTPELVRAFYRHMNASFGARVIAKSDAFEMRAAAWALQAMGITDGAAFLKRFASTVGRRIYVPFVVGEASEGWSLWHQIEVGAHEHQHVVQSDREGAVRFSWLYVRDAAARARFEAEARSTNLELHFWRYGKLPPPTDWVKNLQHYALGNEHIATVKAILDSRVQTIARGGVYTEAGKAAILWLGDNASHLRLKDKP
jgi:hypothetical protein